VKAFVWHDADEAVTDKTTSIPPPVVDRIRRTSLNEVLDGSRYVLLMGGGPLPAPVREIESHASSLRLGTTRTTETRVFAAGFHVTSLAQQLRPDELEKRETEKRQARFRSIWIVLISLLVTVIGITNAMLMSVTERFREIGTMKCLGALSAFIRQIFLFESCLIGAVGGLIGSLVGAFFSILIYALTFGFGVVATALAASAASLFIYAILSLSAGVVLSIIAALYPARVASRMVPANALRSNI
jgi:predicted lysophospholipase L1 biosynthesis ABC-type transport system permease subunit